MKHNIFLALGLAFLVVVNPRYAETKEAIAYTHYFKFKGKEYMSLMPTETLNSSPDFDCKNATLPKSFDELAKISLEELERFTGLNDHWKLHRVNLLGPSGYNTKWSYLLNFSRSIGNDDFCYIPIAITCDGRLGIIKKHGWVK